MSKCSRCGAVRVGEPSAQIACVEVLAVRTFVELGETSAETARSKCSRRGAARMFTRSANPMRRLFLSKCSRCGAMNIFVELGENPA